MELAQLVQDTSLTITHTYHTYLTPLHFIRTLLDHFPVIVMLDTLEIDVKLRSMSVNPCRVLMEELALYAIHTHTEINGVILISLDTG